MKRVVFFLFAALMVAGMGVMAEVSETPEIEIQCKTVFVETGGDLDFPPEAAAPDATGWFYSNKWYLSLSSNCGYRFKWHATPFCLLDKNNQKTDTYLPTKARFGGSLHAGWLADGWVDITYPDWYSAASPAFYGVFTGWIQMAVSRNGYWDKAGTYLSDPTAIVYEE